MSSNKELSIKFSTTNDKIKLADKYNRRRKKKEKIRSFERSIITGIKLGERTNWQFRARARQQEKEKKKNLLEARVSE